MLEDAVVRKVLAAALATGGEWAEVYAEDRLSHNIRLEDRRVEELVTGRDRGAGIRVVKGTASASISTRHRGSSRAATTTMVAAGRTCANTASTGGPGRASSRTMAAAPPSSVKSPASTRSSAAASPAAASPSR